MITLSDNAKVLTTNEKDVVVEALRFLVDQCSSAEREDAREIVEIAQNLWTEFDHASAVIIECIPSIVPETSDGQK